MSKILPLHGVAGLPASELSDDGPLDPSEFVRWRTAEVEELFAAARRGELPRARELKAHEPLTLNEQHLQMVLFRAGGVRQNRIAKHFGVTQSRTSIILNHPDAQTILDRLGAVHAVDGVGDVRERLAHLRGPVLDLIEDFVFDEEQPVEKRVAKGFDLLRLDTELAPAKSAGPNVNVSVALSGAQLGGMLSALRESREIEEASYVVLADEALPAALPSPGNDPEQPGPATWSPERGADGPPQQHFPGTAPEPA